MRYTIRLSKIKWYENELQKATNIQFDLLKIWLTKNMKTNYKSKHEKACLKKPFKRVISGLDFVIYLVCIWNKNF